MKQVAKWYPRQCKMHVWKGTDDMEGPTCKPTWSYVNAASPGSKTETLPGSNDIFQYLSM